MIEAIRKIVIGQTTTDDKKNFIWNMIGCGLYSAVSMFFSFYVIRVLGEKSGGIFAIAITISQMLMYIGYFELRTYQVTDINRKYSFKEYHTVKLIVCFMMMVVSVIYVLEKGYTFEKAIILLLLCVYRMLDAYADLYEGMFQIDGRLDLAGKTMTFRTILSSGVFFISLWITRNMIITLLFTVVSAVVGVIIFDMLIISKWHSLRLAISWTKVRGIIKACFPLFIGAFLWTYILSASRIAIDANMSSEYQAYYQTIFMPVSVINLFAIFFFRPVLTKLAHLYNSYQIKKLVHEILKVILLVIAVTGICMMGAYMIGIPVLSSMVNIDLSPYRGVLVFLLFAGGFNAISYFMYYILTIMRKPKSILLGYISAALLAFFASSPLVKLHGINGAAWSFFIVVMYLCLIFVTLILFEYKTDQKKKLWSSSFENK
ncbi:lipopolysaccharide biosynthesis protein [Parasporobacterium paucivorans]|uniref:Membrane protein involved in the export of O-antigen and teichoic acid n=1 Tax=Parasporobacterium paucivorans DSM 15970 TaxID=1122934 RepID=A0A1M6JU46_9FIRM|nr:oligosaccharide flippase family protein [Parasporobacterium paucivorans]SHJ50208.1 Membrane protein involved in the export of O-antigen and teichoic acid [Parasporobacterium paucivorans DSM 15970]